MSRIDHPPTRAILTVLEQVLSQSLRPGGLDRQVARTLLADERTSPIALYAAALVLFGRGFLVWEPESIWLEARDQLGQELSSANRDKLMAALASHRAEFFWDERVFQNVVAAANNILSDPRTLQEPTPAELAWGYTMGRALWRAEHGASTEPAISDEVAQFTATVLFRNGLQWAPDIIDWCLPHLELLYQGKPWVDIRGTWKGLGNLEGHAYPETPAGTQLFGLALIYSLVSSRAEETIQDLKALRGGPARP